MTENPQQTPDLIESREKSTNLQNGRTEFQNGELKYYNTTYDPVFGDVNDDGPNYRSVGSTSRQGY